MKKEEQNEAFRDELMDYINSLGSWYDVHIYCNGHYYGSNKHGEDGTLCHTKAGTPYYDLGLADVEKQIKYANPESITMTFEGPFYSDINENPAVGEKLNEIGKKYGVYYEQGYAWSLAFYEE